MITNNTEPSHYIARPTEYEGILFKSKSEAIFARGLTLAGYLWEYEPQYFKATDGWVPDFWAVKRGWRNSDKRPAILSLIVEYKPRGATETYLKELWGRYDSMGNRLEAHLGVIACGSSFDLTVKRETLGMAANGGWLDMGPGINLFRKIDEAAQYRFDLFSASQDLNRDVLPRFPSVASTPISELVWKSVLERLALISPFTMAYLRQAEQVSLQNQVFTIGFEDGFPLPIIDNPKNKSLLQTILMKLGYLSMQIEFVIVKP